MQWLAILCALAFGWTAAQAQGNADLMKTPGCLAARKQLDRALAAGGPLDRLNAMREQAALECFGVKPPAQPEGRFVPPPVAVEPIQLPPEPALPPSAGAAVHPALPPLPLAARPPAVTSCDAAGCWDSNGTRYNQLGPMLIGPRGVCTLQGGFLNCP
jgi:hypothetical protein